jgi:hypothetical protein
VAGQEEGEVRTMRNLKIVAVWENTTTKKLEELLEDESLFEFYCPDSNLTYLLKEDSE